MPENSQYLQFVHFDSSWRSIALYFRFRLPDAFSSVPGHFGTKPFRVEIPRSGRFGPFFNLGHLGPLNVLRFMCIKTQNDIFRQESNMILWNFDFSSQLR